MNAPPVAADLQSVDWYLLKNIFLIGGLQILIKEKARLQIPLDGSMFINGGKVALDVAFMLIRTTNPIFLGASVLYTGIDYLTSKY